MTVPAHAPAPPTLPIALPAETTVDPVNAAIAPDTPVPDNPTPDAVDAIAPALGPLESWDIESWLGRDEDAKAYYDSAPAALLTLFDAVVSTDNVPGLLAMLQRLAETDPALESDRRYLKLIGWARRQASR